MRTYNSEAFLVEAIESVLAQSYPHWELILSDDGSTDGTLEIAQAFSLRDRRIVLLQGRHLGAAENGNRCLKAAQNPWVAVLDSDDVALPHRLQSTLNAAEQQPDVVLWGGQVILIDRHGKELRRALVGPRSIEEYNHFRRDGRVIFVMSPTVMFRRDLALCLGGYNDDMDGAEDVELMTRLAEYGPVMALSQDLARYRIHGDSLSSTLFHKQQRVFDFLAVRARLRLGGEDITISQYVESLYRQPAPVRAARWVRDLGRRKYRDTVVNLAERRFVQAAGSGTLAVLLDPAHAYHRIRNRLVKS